MSQSEVYEVERRALLCLAKQESAGVGAKTASAIHLFMVLFGSSGKAASILESASIFYREVKFYVSLKQPKQESIRPEDVEVGGSVQYILHHACENARTRQHGSLHGLHVLQAMLNHPGAPCTLMTQLGADLDVIRANVDSALSLIPPDARIELSTEISPAVEKCPQPPVSNQDEYSEMLDRSKKLADEGLPVTQRVMSVLRNAHEDALRRHHSSVHEIHLALGIIYEGLKTEQAFMKARTSFVYALLHDLESLAHVRYSAIPGMEAKSAVQWPRFESDVKNVLLNALVEMETMCSSAIDLNHIALAIIKQGDVEIRNRIWGDGRLLAARLEQCVAWSNSRAPVPEALIEYLKLDSLDNYFCPVKPDQRPSQQITEAAMHNLSLQSKYALLFAWDKAGVYEQNGVNIDHLLWGVLSAELHPATTALLSEIGLSTEFVQERCSDSIERGVRRVVPDIRLRPLSKRVMMRANMIAEKLGKALTEPDHILLAIFAEDRGLAQPFFEYLNIDAQEAFRSLRLRLEGA